MGLLQGDCHNTRVYPCDKPPSVPGTFSCICPCLHRPGHSTSLPVSVLSETKLNRDTSVLVYPALLYKTVHKRLVVVWELVHSTASESRKEMRYVCNAR